MDDVLPLLVLAAGLAAVAVALTWLARLVRRRGLAGTAVRAALAAYEEAWHVSGYAAHQEVLAQADRSAPAPAPGAPPASARSGIGAVAGRRPPLRSTHRSRLRRLLRRAGPTTR